MNAGIQIFALLVLISASAGVSRAQTLSLATTPNSSTYGATVALTATTNVLGSLIITFGDITDSNNQVILGTATTNPQTGIARIQVNNLPVGSRRLIAFTMFPGSNSVFFSNAVVQTITRIPTTITMSVSPPSSTYGQAVTLRAFLDSPLASGTVTFFDGPTPLGTGTAEFINQEVLFVLTTSALSGGNHTLTASYSGNTNFAPSASSAVPFTVNRASTTVTLSSSPNPSNAGQATILTATMKPPNAAGSITFFDGSVPLGTFALNAAGSASASIATLSAGSHTLTAAYAGNGNYLPATSVPLTQNVNLGVTSTLLSVSPLSSSPGQPVSLTATVTPATASGSVTFRDGMLVIGSASLSNGTAAFSTSSLATGSHVLTASYVGDKSYQPSTSAPITQTVGQTATSTTLSINPVSSASGLPVTFTAVVNPSSVTGSVTFRDGAAVVGTATVTNGIAVFSTSNLPVGTHAITASFGGSVVHNPSTSTPVSVSIVALPTQITMVALPSPSSFGQSVTLTATVSPGNATGAVRFSDAGVLLATVTLNSGAASFGISSLAPGAHSFTATYGGDTTHASSTSPAVAHSVNSALTRTTLSVSPSSSVFGQTVNLTAVVDPAAAEGTIVFRDGAVTVATVTLNAGTAMFSTATFASGSHTLTAVYAGNAGYAASTSPPVAMSVGLQNTQITLDSRPNPADFGQPAVLTAFVTPATATGTVTFWDGSAELATRPLANGQASLSISTLAAGTHALTATYGGNATLGASTSPVVSQTVKSPATTVNLSATPTLASYGIPLTLTATVTPSTATGTITFADAEGGMVPQIVGVTGGRAVFTISSLAAGIHRFIATYSGDTGHTGAESAMVAMTISPASTTTTLAASPLSPSPGQTVTLTAVVSPVTASGIVTFQEGPNTLGTSTLNSGTASFTISTLTLGNHTLVALYSGSANYGSSASTPVNVPVGLAGTAITLVAPASSTFGETVTFTARVDPPAATGTVTFLDGVNAIFTGALTNGTVAGTTSALEAGIHQLTASYSGDARFGSSRSTAVTLFVSRLLSRTVLSATPNPSSLGGPVILTAAVTPPIATGSVTFRDGAVTLATLPLNTGAAVFTTIELLAGDHTIVASYGGDTNHSASESDGLVQRVRPVDTLRVASSGQQLPAGTVSVAYAQTFSAAGGMPPYTWSLVSSSIVDLALSAAGVLSGTPRSAGNFALTVQVRDGSSPPITATANFTWSVAIPPLPAITLIVPPGAIRAPQLTLTQGYPLALSGTVALSFVPNAAGLPPDYQNGDVKFLDGRITARVEIPALSTTPIMLPAIQLGSVAGDVRATLVALATGSGEAVSLPGQPPSVTIALPRTAPAIVPGSVKITNVTSSGFQVELDASSNPRDLSGANLVFTATAGTQLSGTQTFAASLTSAAAAWFAASNVPGVASGGAFTLRIPFAFTGDTSVLGNVAVTLTNSVGTSSAVSGGR